jgi:hypothetical protein
MPEMTSPGIQNGTMMIREGFLLPDPAHIESLSYSKTWRTMAGIDNFAADRKLRAAGWHMFFIAGELKVIELGWGASAVRRGVKRILARGRKNNLNCMEIAQVRPTHCLGFPYVTIRALSFHVQQDAWLESDSERKSEQHSSDWARGEAH